MEKEWKDERSTGRKAGRTEMYKILIRDEKPYGCQKCGKGPSALPPTVPAEISVVDEEFRQGTDFPLEVNHKNKNLRDVNEANLELLCKSCHRLTDQQTEKGVSTIQDEFGYSLQQIAEIEKWPDVLL